MVLPEPVNTLLAGTGALGVCSAASARMPTTTMTPMPTGIAQDGNPPCFFLRSSSAR